MHHGESLRAKGALRDGDKAMQDDLETQKGTTKAWTFRSKVLLAVIFTVVVAALTIQFLAHRATARAMYAAHDENARNLLNTVALSVENEYRSIVFHKTAMIDRRKAELENIVVIALRCIEEYHRQIDEGLLSEEDAKRKALGDVSRMRYDDGVGYLWINDMGEPVPRMVMHPTSPELDGELLDDPRFNCAMGADKNLFTASVEVCRKNGSGYVDYLWPKPTQDGLTEDRPKISYVELFKPWNWVVGTGVYVDDIEAETQRRLDAVLNDIEEMLFRIRIAETGHLFIFTADRKTLISPFRGRDLEAHASHNAEMWNHLLDDLVEAAKTPNLPLDYVWDKPGAEGDYRFRKRAYVTHFEPLDWYIGASFYNEEMEQPAKDLQRRILFFTGLVLVAAIAFAVFISKSLMKPLKELTSSAMAIKREGIDSAQIPVSGTAETIELGAILSKMLASIKETREQREELIRALEAQNAELERFAYSVSHDLKSPLITIKGYIGAIAEDLANGKLESVEADLARVSGAADKMTMLLSNVLELSRIGRLVNPPQDVSLAELAEEAVQLVATQVERKGIEIEISSNALVLNGDRIRLLEVIQNLIENAIKYMGDQPHPRIEIGSRRDGEETVLYVRDNGMGIEPEYHERIFRLFDQLDQSTDGTGIGLALVKRIIEVHGGRIWIESEGLGHGSTFCFTVPPEAQVAESESPEHDTVVR